MNMQFSVVIPLYNKEDYIKRAVDSVLAQSHPHFEVLVVNDGSTDQSESVVRAISDPRLKLINQTNKGLAGARNTGIRRATHDWIAFLDADDEWLPNHLAIAAETLARHPDCRWYFSAYSERYNDGRVIKDHSCPALPSRLDDYFAATLKFHFASCTACVIHRSIFEAVGGFSEHIGCYGEDLEMWFRIGHQFPTVSYRSEITAVYYKMDNTITSTIQEGGNAPYWLRWIKAISEQPQIKNPATPTHAIRLFQKCALGAVKLADAEKNRGVIRDIYRLRVPYSLKARLHFLAYLVTPFFITDLIRAFLRFGRNIFSPRY